MVPRSSLVVGRWLTFDGHRGDIAVRIRAVHPADTIVETFDGRILAARPRTLKPLTFDNHVRFNWGFHDGASDVAETRTIRDISSHYDPAYAEGYAFGVRYARDGRGTESSSPAWDELAALRRASSDFVALHATIIRAAMLDRAFPIAR